MHKSEKEKENVKDTVRNMDTISYVNAIYCLQSIQRHNNTGAPKSPFLYSNFTAMPLDLFQFPSLCLLRMFDL
jgi:hypothetical protein